MRGGRDMKGSLEKLKIWHSICQLYRQVEAGGVENPRERAARPHRQGRNRALVSRSARAHDASRVRYLEC